MDTGIRGAWLGVGLASTLAILLIGGPAGAQQPARSTVTAPAPVLDSALPGDLPDVAPPTIDSGPNEAELQDLANIAEQEGITLDQAIERYAWNDNFSLALEEVRAVSDALAEAAITADGVWVAFAAEVPVEAAGILDRFTAAHPTVDLAVRTGTGFSESALEDALVRVHTAVYDSPGVLEAVTSYDRPARQIVTTVSLLPEADPGLVSTLRAVSAARLADDGGQDIADVLTTRVVLQDTGLTGHDSSAYHYGGEALSTCTSGFVVRRNSDNFRGIAFAEHCGAGSITDDGDALTYINDHYGTHGDMQWRYGPDYEADDFYSGNSTTTEVNRRDVSSYGIATEGQTLCLNGKTTHNHCQQVRQVSVCSSGACNLVQMGNRSAAGGDSGGPWFSGNTAYGIHHGSHCDPFCPYDRDLFTRADRLDDGLGVTVATS